MLASCLCLLLLSTALPHTAQINSKEFIRLLSKWNRRGNCSSRAGRVMKRNVAMSGCVCSNERQKHKKALSGINLLKKDKTSLHTNKQSVVYSQDCCAPNEKHNQVFKYPLTIPLRNEFFSKLKEPLSRNYKSLKKKIRKNIESFLEKQKGFLEISVTGVSSHNVNLVLKTKNHVASSLLERLNLFVNSGWMSQVEKFSRLLREPHKLFTEVIGDNNQSTGFSFLMGPPSPALSRISLKSTVVTSHKTNRRKLKRIAKTNIPWRRNKAKTSSRTVIGRPGVKERDENLGENSRPKTEIEKKSSISYLLNNNGVIDTPSIFSKECLCAHDHKRKAHNVPQLKWSADLTGEAQKLANELASRPTLAKEFQNLAGRNIHVSQGIIDLSTSCPVAVDSWYNEGKKYDYARPGLSGKTEHFTQVIWKSSSHLGVGRAISASGKLVLVARYLPAGNVPGEFDTNVQKPVQNAASSSRRFCSRDYIGPLAPPGAQKSTTPGPSINSLNFFPPGIPGPPIPEEIAKYEFSNNTSLLSNHNSSASPINTSSLSSHNSPAFSNNTSSLSSHNYSDSSVNTSSLSSHNSSDSSVSHHLDLPPFLSGSSASSLKASSINAGTSRVGGPPVTTGAGTSGTSRVGGPPVTTGAGLPGTSSLGSFPGKTGAGTSGTSRVGSPPGTTGAGTSGTSRVGGPPVTTGAGLPGTSSLGSSPGKTGAGTYGTSRVGSLPSITGAGTSGTSKVGSPPGTTGAGTSGTSRVGSPPVTTNAGTSNLGSPPGTIGAGTSSVGSPPVTTNAGTSSLGSPPVTTNPGISSLGSPPVTTNAGTSRVGSPPGTTGAGTSGTSRVGGPPVTTGAGLPGTSSLGSSPGKTGAGTSGTSRVGSLPSITGAGTSGTSRVGSPPGTTGAGTSGTSRVGSPPVTTNAGTSNLGSPPGTIGAGTSSVGSPPVTTNAGTSSLGSPPGTTGAGVPGASSVDSPPGASNAGTSSLGSPPGTTSAGTSGTSRVGSPPGTTGAGLPGTSSLGSSPGTTGAGTSGTSRVGSPPGTIGAGVPGASSVDSPPVTTNPGTSSHGSPLGTTGAGTSSLGSPPGTTGAATSGVGSPPGTIDAGLPGTSSLGRHPGTTDPGNSGVGSPPVTTNPGTSSLGSPPGITDAGTSSVGSPPGTTDAGLPGPSNVGSPPGSFGPNAPYGPSLISSPILPNPQVLSSTASLPNLPEVFNTQGLPNSQVLSTTTSLLNLPEIFNTQTLPNSPVLPSSPSLPNSPDFIISPILPGVPVPVISSSVPPRLPNFPSPPVPINNPIVSPISSPPNYGIPRPLFLPVHPTASSSQQLPTATVRTTPYNQVTTPQTPPTTPTPKETSMFIHLPPKPTPPNIIGKDFKVTIVLQQPFTRTLLQADSLLFNQLKEPTEQAVRNLYADNSYFTDVQVLEFRAVKQDVPAKRSGIPPMPTGPTPQYVNVTAAITMLKFSEVMKGHLILLSSQLDSGTLGSIPVTKTLFAVRVDDDRCKSSCKNPHRCYPACTLVCCRINEKHTYPQSFEHYIECPISCSVLCAPSCPQSCCRTKREERLEH